MKKILYFIILISMLISVLSCGPYSLYHQIYEFRLGMEKTQVIEIINSDELGYGLFIINEIENDTHNLSKIDNEIGDGIEVMIIYKYFAPKTQNTDSYYYLAFKDNKLLYFGLPFEFTRHDNKLISRIGELTNTIVINSYLEK